MLTAKKIHRFGGEEMSLNNDMSQEWEQFKEALDKRNTK
jgi:hypothetical protein